MKRKTDNFNKFFQKKSNAAIKEEFRQEKKAIKKERREAIEKHFEEKRRLKYKAGEPDPDPKSKTQTKTVKGKGYSPAPPANDTRRPLKSPVKRPDQGSTNDTLKKTSSITPSQDRGTRQARGQKPFPAKKSAVPGKKPSVPAKPVTPQKTTAPQKSVPTEDSLPLNKYIAHGGICSRRDAADLIREGKVTVNGGLVTEPGTKVSAEDLVKVNGRKVVISRNLVYILLNKPKDYITTTDDPQGRKTVLDLIRQATTERVYPVGRLDRNTSGVLLLTNDGELAQKLAHPKHEIRKIYHVVLDKALTKADFDKIAAGVALEDGVANVDAIAYPDTKDRTQIGLEIHSGRNRIVRRIFEHLGYDVKGLDRVMYATLTKKNVQRGKWRLLSEKEIRILKYLNSSSK